MRARTHRRPRCRLLRSPCAPYTPDDERSARALADYCLNRLAMKVPLDRPASPEQLEATAGATVTPQGLGADEALRLWADVLGPACLSVDHPRYLSFIPSAPTKAAGRVRHAGRRVERLRRFVAGGVRARSTPRTRRCAGSPTWPGCRRRPAARSSRAARSATCPRWSPPARPPCERRGGRPAALGGLRHRGDALVGQARAARRDGRRRRRGARRRPRGRMTGAALRRRSRDAVRGHGRTASSPSSRPPARPTSAWSTTSPASPTWPPSTAGGCTSTAPTAAPGWPPRASAHLFAGVERADSFIVDPHKWLFAPFDACALLYRDPVLGPRRAHPARRLPRPGHRRGRVEPVRLRDPADPPGPRAAVLVLPRRARHRRLPRRDRADARPWPAPAPS